MISYTEVLSAAETGPEAVAHRLLAEVVAGRAPVRAVRHPLGFICLPVVRDGSDGVCVHWWPSHGDVDLTTEAIHAHSWDLLSFVLYGMLRNDIVSVLDDEAAPTHRVFEVHSHDGGRDEILGTDRTVRVGPAASERNAGGSRYRVHSGDFHTSTVLDADAATLVFGRWLPGAIDLTLAPLDAADHTTQRRTCDAAETDRIARTLLDRLSG